MHNIKITFRKLFRNKLNTLIKIMGITVGLVSVMFIYIYVEYEKSYDNHITEYENIFRIVRNWQASESFSPSTPAPLLGELLDQFPQIETGTRFHNLRSNNVIIDNKNHYEDRIYAVDSSFLNTFNQNLLFGNRKKAIHGTMQVLISKSKAESYFGNENPLGRMLKIEGQEFDPQNCNFEITGVFEDYPFCSHFRPDFLLTLNSFRIYHQPTHANHCIGTYIQLKDKSFKSDLEKQLPAFMRKFYGEDYYEYANSTYLLEPINDIHLNTWVYNYGYETAKGDRKNLTVFPVLGFLIMLIALINFLNLTVSEGFKRLKNFGINKMVGAEKGYFLMTYFSESVIIILFAGLLATIVGFLLLNPFGHLMNRNLSFYELFTPKGIVFLLVVPGLIVLFNTIIPVLLFARRKTIHLFGFYQKRPNISIPFHSISQTIQFAASIFLIIASLIVFKQLKFIENETNKNMNTDNVFIINNARYLNENREAFKDEVLKIAGVRSASLCNDIPGSGLFSTWGYPVDSALKSVHVTVFECDHDYAKTLGIELIKGRFFSPQLASDNDAIVLNEKIVKELGWEENPIGKRYAVGRTFNVIGVAKNVHFEPLQYEIYPQAYIPNRHKTSASYMIIKIEQAGNAGVIRNIMEEWRNFVPDRDIQYGFLDKEFERWYQTERRTFSLAFILCGLATFLSGLGLFAAILFKVQSKIKEIGVRKVNGARIIEIMSMLSQSYVQWVIVAFVIACPISWMLMSNWLKNFAYKTEISWWVFGLAMSITLLISLITVSFQSWRAARRNPVEALRYE